MAHLDQLAQELPAQLVQVVRLGQAALLDLRELDQLAHQDLLALLDLPALELLEQVVRQALVALPDLLERLGQQAHQDRVVQLGQREWLELQEQQALVAQVVLQE